MKPRYSRRRLKKLGIDVRYRRDGILVNINSNGGNVKQHSGIYKMLKESNKKVELRISSEFIPSCASMIVFHDSLKYPF